MRRILTVFGILMMMAGTASAQYYYTKFGQNRIQYKKFDWYFYSTNNFEVYYYFGGEAYAKQALEFLEDEFIELTDVLGYAPYTKTKIFIYNSTQDLQQSNIGIGGDVFTIGGKTDFVKLQTEIAYPGKALEFKQEMIKQLSEILINDMMFGGSLAEIFQNSYLLTLPEWFIDGASRYLAYGWSEDMDDYIRDYLERKKINNNLKLQGEDAALVGQSMWNFIAVKYGEGNISNVLNLTRIIRNEENSIASTLGLTFSMFLDEWQNYYKIQSEEILQNYKQPSEDNEQASYLNKIVRIGHVEMNPAGTKVAYTQHKNGKYDVLVTEVATGKTKKVLDGGYHISNQQIDYNLPLIDWQDDEVLGVLFFKRGNLYLNSYNVVSGDRLQKPLTRFSQIESFSYNDNGKLAVISGDVDGQNDLFLISMRRNALKRITNDNYDDLDPVFVPGTAAIVFSSNRPTDSLEVGKVKLEDVKDVYNLFMYDLDTTEYAFSRLTKTLSKDKKPIVKNANDIFYLSDQKGIRNVFKYSLRDSTFVQVTNYAFNVRDFDLSASGDEISYLMLDHGREKVYTEQSFDDENKIFTPQTARKRLEQAKYVVSRMPVRVADPVVEPEPIKEILEVETFSKVDSLVLPDAFFFSDEETAEDVLEEEPSDEDSFIDIDNYVFEDEAKPVYKPESYFSNFTKFERKPRVLGPIAYQPRFSFSNLITSAAVDPLRKFSFLLESEITDILENHRITGGVLTNQNFDQGDIYLEYDYLKYWMDFKLRIDRKSYLFGNLDLQETYLQKYVLTRVEASAALPVTNTLRFEISPFVTITDYQNLEPNYLLGSGTETYAPESKEPYFGGRGSMVFDNTIERGFNIYQGTRGIFEYSTQVALNTPALNFSKITGDFRHYQKIHKEITFATRVYYGRSMGNNPQSFLLGGMQNWLFARYQYQGTNDPLGFSPDKDNSNILFSEFVTNLRGFDYNHAVGRNVLLLNAELRFPLFRYFSRGPIASNFLRNFQLIGFYDMGSVWNKKSPFSSDFVGPSITYSPEEAWSAEIFTFQNPWLVGYGWGLRTVLLGYYLKVDVAKPIQDYQVGKTRIYLTIGLDF